MDESDFMSDEDKNYTTSKTLKSIRKPQFNVLHTQTQLIVKCCKQPNYKNLKMGLIFITAFIFLILQLFTYYCIQYIKNCMNVFNVNPIHVEWVSSLTTTITLTVINTLLRKKHERTILKVASIFTFLTQMSFIAFLSLLVFKLQNKHESTQSLQVQIISLIYVFITVFLGGIAIGFQIVGCFCYMIQCIPNKSDKGLIIGLFLLSVILGKNLHQSLEKLQQLLHTQIVVYTGLALSLSLIFLIDYLMPVVSFGEQDVDPHAFIDDEYDVNNMNLTTNTDNQQITKSEHSDPDQRSANDDFDDRLVIKGTNYPRMSYDIQFQKSQNLVEKSSQLCLQNTEQLDEPKKLKLRIPKWIRFYSFVLFKTLNGLVLLLQSFFQASYEQTMQFYSQLQNSNFTLPRCSENPEQDWLSPCWLDKQLFKYYNLIGICIEISCVILMGYLFDLSYQRDKNINLIILQYYQIYCFLGFICIIIPSLININLTAIRDIFILLLMVNYSYSQIFIQLNIITIFRGGFRVAVCMVFSFIYLFDFIFDVSKFFNGFVGNGWFELCNILFMIILYSLFEYKLYKKI